MIIEDTQENYITVESPTKIQYAYEDDTNLLEEVTLPNPTINEETVDLNKSPIVDSETGLELIIDPDENPDDAMQIEQELMNPLPPMPPKPFLPAFLGAESGRYTLVLDLDETLIHFNDEGEFFAVRPGCQDFLRTLSIFYEIVVFTASV